MGKNKKYLIKSVNLGEVGHPSRILAEMYIKKFGANEFSALIRKLMMIFYLEELILRIGKKKR